MGYTAKDSKIGKLKASAAKGRVAALLLDELAEGDEIDSESDFANDSDFAGDADFASDDELSAKPADPTLPPVSGDISNGSGSETDDELHSGSTEVSLSPEREKVPESNNVWGFDLGSEDDVRLGLCEPPEEHPLSLAKDA